MTEQENADMDFELQDQTDCRACWDERRKTGGYPPTFADGSEIDPYWGLCAEHRDQQQRDEAEEDRLAADAQQRIKYEQLEKRLALITSHADREMSLLPLDTEPATVDRRRFICAQRDIRHALEHWSYQLETPLPPMEMASMMILLAGDLLATALLQVKATHSAVDRRTALLRGLNTIFQNLIRQGLIPPDGTPPPSPILDVNGNPFRRS